MKKLALALFACLSFAACSKSSTTPTTTTPTTTTPTIPTDGWTLNGTTYKSIYGLKQGDGVVTVLDATSKPNHIFSAIFKNYPTANGTYHIVALKADSTSGHANQNLADNEVLISAAVPGTTSSYITYFSTGTDGKDATVTVTNGKIKVEVPEVAVTDLTNTYKVTGTITEN